MFKLIILQIKKSIKHHILQARLNVYEVTTFCNVVLLWNSV